MRVCIFPDGNVFLSCISPPSDLCEQRMRPRRLHQSGEWKEERFCAVRRPGNHLKRKKKIKEKENAKMKREATAIAKLQIGLKHPEDGVCHIWKCWGVEDWIFLVSDVCVPPSAVYCFFCLKKKAKVQFKPKKMNLTLITVHFFSQLCYKSLIFSLFPRRYSVFSGIPEYHHDKLPSKSVQNHLCL